jgi:hypothetical protein
MRSTIVYCSCLLLLAWSFSVNAQTTVRPRPAEWNNLVYGGRFMDRFLPMPNIGQLTRDTWGDENVLPRFINNGIENRDWSFWGGNIKMGEDGKYHLFVCGWPERSPKGHATWPNSTVFHAVSNNSFGPFVVRDTIGKGHNPEIFRLKDGRYVLYVIGGYYIADGVNGPWKYDKFEFLNRDRRLIEGNSNFTFAQREDGSYLMICRGGGQWFSQTGLSSYNQVTGTRLTSDIKIVPLRAYPAVEGRFEDPVVWRDNVQYNLVVNDWLGRIAFYERSKDGVNWKVESGEAYMPGVAKHEDGSIEGWFKLERMKIFQDSFGRAIQANFAVIDVEKKFDLARDIHSSKNICIPLAAGRLLTIMGKKPIKANTKSISVKIAAEDGFNPQTDINLPSLRFGDPEEVNYGKGSKMLKTEKSGNDLIVTFDGAGARFAEDEFAAKLLGKTTTGKLLYGYARLPGTDFIGPLLSALLPQFTPNNNGFDLKVEVRNFGQVESKTTTLKVVNILDNREETIASGKIPILKPYEQTSINLTCGSVFNKGAEYTVAVIINPEEKKPVKLHGKLIPLK